VSVHLALASANATVPNKVRSDWARENYRGSLVVFFRYGTSVKWNKTTQRWVVGPATFAFSGSDQEFVAMNQGTELLLLAHESGHYFHLNHTQGDAVTLTDDEKAKYPDPQHVPADREGGGQLLGSKLAEAIRVYVDDQGNPPELGLNVLDADGLADTAPDPGPQIFLYEYADACATQSINVDVNLKSGTRSYTVDPDRGIIMSYFFRCPGGKRYSDQEIDIIRRSLETVTFPEGVLSRHHLVAIREPERPIVVQFIRWLVERISSIVSGIVESLPSLMRRRS